MTKHLQLTALCALVVAALFVAATRANLKSLDVVGNDSVASFGEILRSFPDGVAESGTHWSLTAPDKSARFSWSRNSGAGEPYGVMLTLDAEPFLKAGLDPEKLPGNYVFSETGTAEMAGHSVLTVGSALGATAAASGADSTAVAAYSRIVDTHRDRINYHSFLDHYGVKLGGGNMFEWAKNMRTNEYDNTVQDKDIVFALNPEPFIKAGVDPEKIDGWLHAQVPVMTGGSTGLEWLLLKPFDLQ